MKRGPNHGHLTLLERLDLTIATRLVGRIQIDDPGDVDRLLAGWTPTVVDGDVSDSEWIAEVLRLRGYAVLKRDVEDILHHRPARFAPDHQEFLLILGMRGLLDRMREGAERGAHPDGKTAIELFEILTERIARFRNNVIRRDMPWDGVLYVPYPEAADVPGLLDTFDVAHGYGEGTQEFAALHPVRQAVRVLWRFARIAPFPDLNTIMAFALMNAHLLACGYPRMAPVRGDRDLLARLIGGSPPPRIVQFESRLLSQIE